MQWAKKYTGLILNKSQNIIPTLTVVGIGRNPRWSPDGKVLGFINASSIVQCNVDDQVATTSIVATFNGTIDVCTCFLF